MLNTYQSVAFNSLPQPFPVLAQHASKGGCRTAGQPFQQPQAQKTPPATGKNSDKGRAPSFCRGRGMTMKLRLPSITERAGRASLCHQGRAAQCCRGEEAPSEHRLGFTQQCAVLLNPLGKAGWAVQPHSTCHGPAERAPAPPGIPTNQQLFNPHFRSLNES